VVISDSESQTVKIYNLDGKITYLTGRVLEAMDSDKKFWANYQIRLDFNGQLTPLEKEHYQNLD